jgi:outer membrane lipoprotein
MKLLSFLALTLFLLAGCAHQAFTPETRKLVDPAVTFAMVREDPGQYVGKNVMVGGAIAKVRNTGEGGELEVVEFRVTDDGKPQESASSGGRFLARSERFLDPLVFRQGLMVSLVGEVAGETTMSLDGTEYTYPVIAVKALHLWKPEEMYRTTPLFHFGIGVFHGF